MKLMLILLLTICSSGCSSFPLPEFTVERCVTILSPIEKCRCHQYQVSSGNIGRVTESTDKDVRYCDRKVGFSPEDWIKFIELMEEAYGVNEDHAVISSKAKQEIWELTE